jgi:serine/threonine protein kinase
VRPPAELDSTVPDSPLSSRGAGSGLRALPGRQRCPSCGAEFPASYQVCPHDATPLGAAGDPTDPLVGVVLAGTYRLGRAIGRGGMGRLYGAEHTRLGRRFAVKVLQHEHAEKAEAVKRFEREAEALARIRSDFVLDVVDVLRTPDGRTAIVTALLEGEDLQRRLDRAGTLATSEALAIARQLCRGLAAAHAVGVVHRDLKPSNLFLAAAPDGRLSLKILDFGVAKLGGDDAMTRTGVVLGTPAYMPPEQARGSSRADPRSDVYGVGAVLYRMLTGRMPYDGEDPGATLARLLIEAPPRPRTLAPELPVAIEMLIQRAMARDPRERPTTALELESELAALSGEEAHEGGASTPRVVAGASRSPETLVLPYGAIDRADARHRRRVGGSDRAARIAGRRRRCDRSARPGARDRRRHRLRDRGGDRNRAVARPPLVERTRGPPRDRAPGAIGPRRPRDRRRCRARHQRARGDHRLADHPPAPRSRRRARRCGDRGDGRAAPSRLSAT